MGPVAMQQASTTVIFSHLVIVLVGYLFIVLVVYFCRSNRFTYDATLVELLTYVFSAKIENVCA